MNEVTIPLKIQGIAQIKAELRELKGELANATDPEQIARLSQQAGVLSDKIKDANDQVKVFASGSKFEQVSNGLGGIKDSLMSLDFAEASDKAKVFSTTLGSLNPADIGKAMTGLVTTVGTLGKAFLKLGAQLLVNPIFLMVAVVVAVVLAFTLWEDKLGKFGTVLKVVFINIYLLVEAVKFLIQGFKDLTDWMGLTSFAAEENAARTEAANKKVTESSKEREAQVVGDLQREVNEAKAAGEDTTKLEEKISNTKIKEANKRKQSAKEAIAAQKKLGDDADAKKLEDLRKQVIAENEIIKQGYSDKEVAKNTADKKAADDAKAKQKAANEKYIAADKKSLEEVAAARKIVADSTKTDQQREIDDLNAAYAKKIADATKYKNDTKALTEAQAIEIAAINKKYADAAQAKIDADAKAANEKRIAYEDAAFLEMQRLTLRESEFKVLQATQAAEAKMNQFTNDAEMIKLLEKELAADIVQIKKDAKDQEVEDAKKAQEAKDKIAEEGRQKEFKGISDGLQMSTDALNTINSLASIGMDAKLKNVKKGSKEEEKILRAQFKQQKAMQLAMAAINGAQAIVSILAQYPKFDGGFAMAAALAASAAGTIASIATISATQFNAPAAQPSADTGAGAATTAVAPAVPQLFGQANTGNNMTLGGLANNNMTVTAVVSETEITATQHHINNIQNNSKL